MRHLSLVGVVRNRKVIKLARRCAWCRTWLSAEDYVLAHTGARVTHSICPICERRMQAQIDAMPGPTKDGAA